MTPDAHPGKAASAPLLSEHDPKHSVVGSSEIKRISWRRAVGVFHLYLVWLIAELIGLCVARAEPHAPRRTRRDDRTTTRTAHGVCASVSEKRQRRASVFFEEEVSVEDKDLLALRRTGTLGRKAKPRFRVFFFNPPPSALSDPDPFPDPFRPSTARRARTPPANDRRRVAAAHRSEPTAFGIVRNRSESFRGTSRSAVGLIAVTSDHWIVPTGSAFPFVARAGLWKVCYTSAAVEPEGRREDARDSFDRIEDWWTTVDDAFVQIGDGQVDLSRVGCTRRVAEFYGHVWGNDFLAWLQIVRAFCVLFLWVGFLKILVVTRTYVSTTRGRWLSSAFATFLAACQILFGEVAWFLALSVIQIAQDDAPAFLDRGTFESYDGWAFWAFFASVQFCFLVTSMYLFVEAAACCVDERRRRFGVFGQRPRRAPGGGRIAAVSPRKGESAVPRAAQARAMELDGRDREASA
jgi:hypothetical protein